MLESNRLRGIPELGDPDVSLVTLFEVDYLFSLLANHSIKINFLSHIVRSFPIQGKQI